MFCYKFQISNPKFQEIPNRESGFRNQLPLPLLEAGILFVNDIQLALATHDLTICTTFLDGCSDFHFDSFYPRGRARYLFIPEIYSSPGQVIRRKLYSNFIAG
jgi:hypothetical protein